LIVTVNGETREVREGMTLLELLHQLELRPEQVAVERNLHVVPRKSIAGVVLEAGDLLEIVTLVGGG